MNCSQSHGLFGAYWDDELTQAEREWLEAHFAGCSSCRTDYEQFARTIEMVGSLPRAESAPDLAERALARARRVQPARDRIPVGAPVWIPATATIALAAIAVTVVLQFAAPLIARRVGGPTEDLAVRQPVLVRAASTTVPTTRPDTGSLHAGTSIPDSLFDHAEDVEFVLDPVTVRKGRAHPASRLAPRTESGAQAVITF
ncbi:MAG: anti-sigma factor family protein [Candidatus Eisenbacteria bacterium]